MSITKKADNFYQEVVLHLKTPEKITMLLILLFICKYFFPSYFEKILSIVKSSIPHFAFAIEVLLIFSFILSVLFFISMFLVISYKPIANKKYERISRMEDLRTAGLYIGDYYKLLYGAKIKVLRAATWLWVLSGYFYLVEESKAVYIFNLISEKVMSDNNFVISTVQITVLIIYSIFVGLSGINLLKNMTYHFLYLRTDRTIEEPKEAN